MLSLNNFISFYLFKIKNYKKLKYTFITIYKCQTMKKQSLSSNRITIHRGKYNFITDGNESMRLLPSE